MRNKSVPSVFVTDSIWYGVHGGRTFSYVSGNQLQFKFWKPEAEQGGQTNRRSPLRSTKLPFASSQTTPTCTNSSERRTRRSAETMRRPRPLKRLSNETQTALLPSTVSARA